VDPFAQAREADPMRHRLVTAGLRAMARHGYVGCTVAEIVAEARTSRRAFYAHFSDREDCLLAGYELATDTLMARMDVDRSARERWPDRVLAGLDTYLRSILDGPDLARVFIVEIHRCGPKADTRRMAVHRRWAEWQSANSRLDLELPGPPGVVRRALTVEEALASLAATTEILAHALISGERLDGDALRRQLGFILLSFTTSSVPADLWAPAPAEIGGPGLSLA
jgi:AcrR family transcriptional regulator